MRKTHYLFSDTWTMFSRVMKHTTHSLDTLLTVIIMPIAMMLASVYIYGGAMDVSRSEYVTYLTPGILFFTMATGVSYAAYRFYEDISTGIYQRFHSMPLHRASIVGGHICTSLLFNLIACLSVFLLSLFLGFTMSGTIGGWLIAIIFIMLFNLVATLIALYFGKKATSLEATSGFSYLLLGLIFTSSAMAPSETMGSGLQYFVRINPFTPIIYTVRAGMSGDFINTTSISLSIMWCGLFILLFGYLLLKESKKVQR